MNSKSILWINWKGIDDPRAGGAETVNHEICKRLVEDGCTVTLITSRYPGAAARDRIDGIDIVRVGRNKYLHPFQTLFLFLKNFRESCDIIIETVNTVPYFLGFFKGRSDHYLFYHQLARKVWFYEAKFPLSFIGYYVLEPVATLLQSLSRSKVITVSESSKKDLSLWGFNPRNVSIISEGINVKPLENLQKSLPKEKEFTILYLGSLRRMKRPLEVLKAFEIFHKSNRNSQLWIAGGGDEKYIEELKQFRSDSNLTTNITFWGRVPDSMREELLQKAHVISVTSIKEGWGLVVTEAGAMGTPAVVYDVDGLRDSVLHEETGFIVHNNSVEGLAQAYERLLRDTKSYTRFRTNALNFAREINFDQSYADFYKAVNIDHQRELIKLQEESLVSVIIPTLNAWHLVKDLLDCLENQTYQNIEIIINDDKRSTDNIGKEMAQAFPQLRAKVIHENKSLGQARYSGTKKAKGKYVLHVDADFQPTQNVVRECVMLCENSDVKGVIIPEEVIGSGFWTKAKWLEGEMYNGDDMMESPRFFDIEAYWKAGGHDSDLALSEDKDMDLRFRKQGFLVDRIKAKILHNERRISLIKNVRRKFFWGQSATDFISKQSKHAVRQGNILFRPAYFRSWRRILRHPVLFTGVILMKFSEAVAVVLGILFTKVFRRKILYKN